MPTPCVIELWRVDLTAADDLDALQDDDRRAAERFQDPAAGWRWAAGRTALRRILGQHLGVAPAAVVLARGPWGKPFIADGPAFNFSASGDHAVIALRPGTSGAEIGVDLETAAVTGHDLRAVAAGPLSETDSSDARARWTRLEALLKSTGRGFSRPVSAALIAGLAAPHGQALIDGRAHWWRDHPHPAGSLCLAADAPWARIVERSCQSIIATPEGRVLSAPR